MAKKDATPNPRPSPNSRSPALPAPDSPPSAAHTPNLLPLRNIVEDERARLMTAHAILSTVIAAMEAEGVCTNDGPYWPSVIETARDLVDESIRKLEDFDRMARPDHRKANEVRESVPYCSRTYAARAALSTFDGNDWGMARVN